MKSLMQSFSPLLQLKWFFRLATERKLTGSDQLMYLHIFNKFNEARWTETLRIKDAELKESMRLFDTEGRPASIEILRRGRQRLKGKGFIDFKSGGGHEPEYKLIRLYPEDTRADTPAYTRADTPLGSGLVSYTRAREDNKTEDLKNNPDSAGANDDDLDNLIELWEAAGGAKLNQLLLSKLASLLDTYAYETIKVAIKQAAESNNSKYGFSFKFLTAILEKDKTPGGGERSERQREYEKPPEYEFED